MRSAVIGAGSWGTALASLLAGKGGDVAIWDIDPVPLDAIRDAGENTRYLPGIPLPAGLRPEPDLEKAVTGAELVVLAVPSHAMREVAGRIAPHLPESALICSVTKGIEVDTLMMMNEVLEDVLPVRLHRRLAFLSGPSFAIEVAQGMPTAVTIAAAVPDVARAAQEAFHTPFFRPYTSDDIVGAEIGGCAKNVVAIATGLADGMGFDANARAALITRGLAEITRLGVAKGANPRTLSGLSGVGDLVLTCSSAKSRNYRVGYGLGQGGELEEIQASLGSTAEGVRNAKSVHDLARSLGVEMPICDAVHGLIYEGMTPKEALLALTARALKDELDD